MATIIAPFGPDPVSVTIAATVASATAPMSGGGTSLLVTNASTGVAFWRVGVGAQTAVLTDTPVLAGTSRTFSIPYTDVTDVGVILSTGTGNVYFTRGEGN